MTRTMSINEISMAIILSTAEAGDEIVIESNGKQIAKILPIEPIEKTIRKQRIFGLGKGKSWLSEDFNNELPDEFWGFEREI